MLRFNKLIVENFGPFKKPQTIEFTDKNGVTIIWGDNGRGKTTLLNVFRYALFGFYKDRGGAEVEIKTLINKEGYKEGKYGFQIILYMENGNKKYELTRMCTVRDGVKEPMNSDDYEQKTYLKENGSLLSSAARDHTLDAIMPKEVSRFFLFDGELLKEYEELLSRETESGKKIKDSIERILGLPVLTNGETDTNSVFEDYKNEKNKIAQSNEKTQQYSADLAALEEEKKLHEAEIERQTKELDEERQALTDFESEKDNNSYIKVSIDKMNALKGEIDEYRKSREKHLAEIRDKAKNVWKDMVYVRVKAILENLQEQIKELEAKEKSYVDEQRILECMVDAKDKRHCKICNQNIDDVHMKALSKKIKEIMNNIGGLTEEEKYLLSNLRKREIDLKGIEAENISEILKYIEDQLDEESVKINDKEGELRNIVKEIEEHGTVDEIEKKSNEIILNWTRCGERINNLREGIRKENEKLNSTKDAIKRAEDNIDRNATDADTELAKKKMLLSQQINKIFKKGIDAYRKKLKVNVENDATKVFLGIRSDPDYEKLRINDNYGLEIVHVSGEIAPLRSAGYEHVVAISLIGALHKNAPLQGPIIMDSPFGRLDTIHKRNLVKMLPKMSNQVVMLVFPNEIDEQEVRAALGGSLRNEYKLVRDSSFITEIVVQ